MNLHGRANEVQKASLPARSRLPLPRDDRPAEHAAQGLLGVGSLAMMGFGIVAGSRFALGTGAMMAGGLVLWRVLVDVRRGVTSSNWGTWRRTESRAAFQRNVWFWGVIAVLWFVAGAVAMTSLISMPSHSFR